MSEIILYITQLDAELIREWINAEACIAWIVADDDRSEPDRWRAVDQLDCVHPQSYSLWHKECGPLTIPSGSSIPDAEVDDPFAGWSAPPECEGGSTPWFGANLPGPYDFRFRDCGRESLGSLGRSGFAWHGDHYRLIGKGAHPLAKRWWERLRRFVKRNAVGVPWPDVRTSGRTGAYIFPQAYGEFRAGRALDLNP